MESMNKTSPVGWIIIGGFVLVMAIVIGKPVVAAFLTTPDPAKERVQYMQYHCQDLRDKAVSSLSTNDQQTLRYTCPAFE